MNSPWGLEAEIVADASTRQVVLIVEDEALVRMIAVDMIDYSTGLADATFHFAVKPDGSPAQ